MDFDRSTLHVDGDSSFPWGNAFLYVAVAHTLFEYYINNRELNVLHRSARNSANIVDIKGLAYVHYNSYSAFYRFLVVLVIVSFDAIPRLWALVARVQQAHLGPLYDSDWGRSYLFLNACYLSYTVLSIPQVYFRMFLFGESIKDQFTSRRERHSIYRHVAQGQPVATVVVLFAVAVLYYKIFEKKLGTSFIFWSVGFQMAFTFFQPLLSQPRGKHLSIMEAGKTREAIQELAETVGFPLKEIYIMSQPWECERYGVQAWGWPRKTYIIVSKQAMNTYKTNHITALLAQELGAWKYGNGVWLFAFGQMLFNLTTCFLLLFAKQRSVYEAFGFIEEYPFVAAIVLFAVGIAPPLSAIYKCYVHFMRRGNQFYADKFAADLGYSDSLAQALRRVECATYKSDWLYSWFYNAIPLISERVAALERGDQIEDSEKKGAIRL